MNLIDCRTIAVPTESSFFSDGLGTIGTSVHSSILSQILPGTPRGHFAALGAVDTAIKPPGWDHFCEGSLIGALRQECESFHAKRAALRTGVPGKSFAGYREVKLQISKSMASVLGSKKIS